MKRSLYLLLVFCMGVLLLCACTDTTILPEETHHDDTSLVTESPTEIPIEAPTEGETQTPETELFENSGLTPVEPMKGSAILSKPYTEKITTTDGSVTLNSAGITVNFNSQFYGHDSAIDRDLIRYGWTFNMSMKKLSVDANKGEFFLCELTGDHYQDMVLYVDGTLTVYPAVVDTKKTFEYNGKIYDSVYADANSLYSFGDAITFELNLPETTLRGTGDFDGNGYGDFLLVQADGTVVLGLSSENGITPTVVGKYHGETAKLYSGDVNADGLCDLIMIDGYTVTSMLNTGEGFAAIEPVALPFTNAYSFVTVGDINNDRRVDVIWFEEDESCFRTMFGRGDGFFGPHPEEMGEAQGNKIGRAHV